MIQQEEQIRVLSKRLYGGSYRLEVAAAVADADPGVVSASDLTEALGLPADKYTVIRRELEGLAQAGILVRLPRPRGQRIQEYERLPSEYWGAARSVLAEVARTTATEDSMTTPDTSRE